MSVLVRRDGSLAVGLSALEKTGEWSPVTDNLITAITRKDTAEAEALAVMYGFCNIQQMVSA